MPASQKGLIAMVRKLQPANSAGTVPIVTADAIAQRGEQMKSTLRKLSSFYCLAGGAGELPLNQGCGPRRLLKLTALTILRGSGFDSIRLGEARFLWADFLLCAATAPAPW